MTLAVFTRWKKTPSISMSRQLCESQCVMVLDPPSTHIVFRSFPSFRLCLSVFGLFWMPKKSGRTWQNHPKINKHHPKIIQKSIKIIQKSSKLLTLNSSFSARNLLPVISVAREARMAKIGQPLLRMSFAWGTPWGTYGNSHACFTCENMRLVVLSIFEKYESQWEELSHI